MKHLFHLALCSVCLVVFCLPVLAQNIQNPQSSVDNLIRSNVKVDSSTGAMQLQIPLGQYPGRGQAALPVTLNYSSKVWNIKHQSTLPCNGEPVTSYRPEFAKGSASGWTSTLGWFLPTEDLSLETYEGLTGKPAQQGNPTLFRIMRKFVRLPDGSRHEVRKDDTRHSLSDSLFGMYYAVDGSRLTYDLATNTTFLPDGSRIIGDNSSSVQYIDRNGNFMTFSSGSWTDTLGRTFGVPIPGTAPAAGDVVYTLPGGLTYTFRWRNLADALTDPTQPLEFPGDAASANCTIGGAQPGTLFSTLDGNNKILKGQLFNPVVLWQISLSNNTNYTFTYNVYGEITKVVYPTGGTESFSYGKWKPLGGQLDDGTYSQANRGVNSRIVSDGVTAPQIWTYGGNNFEPGVDPATDVRIVTAPNGTVTKTWYYISRGTQIKYGFDDARTGMVREERVYNSSGTMLRRTVNQLAMDGPLPGGFSTATRNARVTKTVSIILDTGGNALASATEMTYDADLNVTSTRQYEFFEIPQATAQTGDLAAMTSGTLVRTQETDYLTTDANYRARNMLSLPIATRVKNGVGTIIAQSSIAYDETALLTYGALTGWSDPGMNARGNATTSSSWLNTTGANLSSHMQYDQCGNVRNIWDAKDTSQTNPTQIEYSAAFQRAYPTLNTSPDPDAGGPLVALVTATDYDGATGLVTSTTDANGQQTTFSYNDPLLRLKQVIRAAGDATVKNQTTYNYDDVGRTVTVTSDLNNFGDNVLKSLTLYDTLGRPVESRTYEDATNFIASQTQYDTMGRANMKSNPFRPLLGESAVWTTTVFDALGRVRTVTTPDNAVVDSSYSGNTVTVTDQVGKKRTSVSDALGRLTDVFEDPLGLNYQTTYGYDALDNLTTVTQLTQTRTFVYDSLKRLTSATNPESGTITYQYDNNGNLTLKTDARGISLTYVYDALNRNTTVDYSNTTINPDITRIYDSGPNGKGRLRESYTGGTETAGANVEHTKIIGFDALGRPQEQRQRFKTNNVWSAEFKVVRGYNRADGVTSQTYPSDRIASYTYDDAGRTSGFTGNLGDGSQRTYSTGIIYSAFGGISKEQFGTATALYNKSFYTSRGQLAEIRVGLTYTGPTDSGWERGAVINHYSGQCWGACVGQNMTDNNGNLRQQDHWIPDDNGGTQAVFVQTYAYDSLNRLLRVTEGSNWQQEFVYDRWGNRTIHQTNTFGLNINKKDFTVNTTNNQLGVPGGQGGAMSYDPAGNLTTDTYTGMGDRVYDAENRMTKAWGGNSQWQEYTYNADGQRTRRKLDGQETWQIYGMDGELLAEYPALATPSSPQKEYGYRNGALLVTATATTGWGAPPVLHDNPLIVTETTVQALHITELRDAINALRSHLNLSAYSWQYSVTTNDFITANPILEMRTALDQALGAPGAGYAAGLAQGQLVKAIHIQELRDRVLGAWNSTGSTDIRWLVSDQQGTPRMIFDQTGSLANVSRNDYLPFGEELNAGTGGRTPAQGYTASENVRQKFTAKERDVETGLDYFEARYYASTQGRFTSIDPYNIVMKRQYATNAKKAESQFNSYLSNPQRWARYTYALNNPLLYTDPHGEDVTIYYRPPKSGGGSKDDWGHILIYVKNDETGESAYFDYIATGDRNNFGATQLNGVNQERIDAHASITIETSGSQEQAILDGIKSMQQSSPDYEVSRTSGALHTESTCTSQSIRLLALGGINVGPTLMPQTPTAVWESAFKQYGDFQANRAYLPSPNPMYPNMVPITNGYNNPPQVDPKGREYGHDPRGQARVLDRNATNNVTMTFRGGKRVQ